MGLLIVTKAAFDNFTRCWTQELANDGVRVNAIVPGVIETNIWNVIDLSPEMPKSIKNLWKLIFIVVDLEHQTK